MPQTSPMNWMLISLIFYIFVIINSFYMMNMKMSFFYQIYYMSLKKIFWLW